MGYIIDILFLVILGIIIISSTKKGFIRSLFELVGTLISFVAARLLSENLAPTFFEKFIRAGAETALKNNLGSVATTDYGAQIEGAINSIPDSFSSLLSLIGIEKAELIEKISSSELSEGNLLSTIMENIVEPVGTAVLQFVLFAVLVALITVVLRVVVRLVDSIIKKLPAIKQMNSALGAVVGIIRGALVCIIVAMILAVVAGFISNEQFLSAVDSSFVVGLTRNLITTLSGISI